jgi:hypothetical protein
MTMNTEGMNCCRFITSRPRARFWNGVLERQSGKKTSTFCISSRRGRSLCTATCATIPSLSLAFSARSGIQTGTVTGSPQEGASIANTGSATSQTVPAATASGRPLGRIRSPLAHLHRCWDFGR